MKKIQKKLKVSFLFKQLNEEMVHLIKSGTRDQKLTGCVYVRKLLSKEISPPIDEVIEAGLVPLLIELLSFNESEKELKFEAAWCLTNIASGTHSQTECLVKAGAITQFIKLCSSQDAHIVEQSIWALGNIAGDNGIYRDLVLDSGIVEPLIKYGSKFSSPNQKSKLIF
jgi:importin subunit alpha-1